MLSAFYKLVLNPACSILRTQHVVRWESLEHPCAASLGLQRGTLGCMLVAHSELFYDVESPSLLWSIFIRALVTLAVQPISRFPSKNVTRT